MKEDFTMKITARVIAFLFLVSVLVWSSCIASAETPVGVAFVTCTQCTLRSSPASNASSNGKLKNGDYVVIIGEEYNSRRNEDFYAVVSRSSWDQGLRNVEGYVLKQYLKTGLKPWITLPSSTVIWAMPGSQVAVGERSTGNTLVVLDEISTYNQYTGRTESFWCVQMQDTVGGAGFVSKAVVSETWTRPEDQEFYHNVMGSWSGNIPSQNNGGQNPPSTAGINGLQNGGQAVVNCQTLAVRARPDDNQKSLGFLHNGDVVQVSEIGDYYTSIYYSYKGVTVIGYVHTEHLLGIAP